MKATKCGTITAQEIAKSQKVDELLVGMLAPLRSEKRNLCQQYTVRVMRLLTAVGICDETGISEYSPNSVTGQFTSEGFGDGVKCMFVTPSINSEASTLTM